MDDGASPAETTRATRGWSVGPQSATLFDGHSSGGSMVVRTEPYSPKMSL